MGNSTSRSVSGSAVTTVWRAAKLRIREEMKVDETIVKDVD